MESNPTAGAAVNPTIHLLADMYFCNSRVTRGTEDHTEMFCPAEIYVVPFTAKWFKILWDIWERLVFQR